MNAEKIIWGIILGGILIITVIGAVVVNVIEWIIATFHNLTHKVKGKGRK